MKKILLLLLAATAAGAAPVFQMRLVVDARSTNAETMTFVHTAGNNTFTNVLHVQKTVLLDQTALESATAGQDALNHPIIDLVFSESGARRFADITRQNTHKELAIIIDGQVCQTPVIQGVISGGEAQVSGNFTRREAESLAKKITGALQRK